MMIQASNPNPMSAIWYLLLIVLSCMAVVGGKGVKWKLLNLLIILGFMVGGVAVGFAFGAWGSSGKIAGDLAFALMPLLGCVGAFGCMRRNKAREKATENSSNSAPSE
jgi:hypothetical protein